MTNDERKAMLVEAADRGRRLFDDERVELAALLRSGSVNADDSARIRAAFPLDYEYATSFASAIPPPVSPGAKGCAWVAFIAIAAIVVLFIYRVVQAVSGGVAEGTAQAQHDAATAARVTNAPRVDPRVVLMHSVNQDIVPKMVEGNPKKYIGQVVRFRCKIDSVDQAVTNKSFLNHEATADAFCNNPDSEYDTSLIKLHGDKVQNLDKDEQIVVVCRGRDKADPLWSR